MSAAHTPGPWKYSPPDDQVADLFTPEYFFIEGPGADVHGHMTLADARLIAAAPDLLAALQGLLAVVKIAEAGKDGKPHQYLQSRSGSMVFSADAVAASIDAIFKATGEKA